MLWLTGTHLNWVVLVSFTPFLYSGLYSLFSFALKILLTLTLGSRKYFLPESPVIPDDGLIRQKTSIVLSDVSLENLCPSLLRFPFLRQPLWMTTYKCRSYFLLQLLLFYEMQQIILSGIRPSSVVMGFESSSNYYSIFRIPSNLLLLTFITCLCYG